MWPTDAGRWNAFDDPQSARRDAYRLILTGYKTLFGNSFTHEHSIERKWWNG